MSRDDDLIDKNFPEEAQEERHARIMRVLSLFAVAAVVIFIAAIGYFYFIQNKNLDPNNLPLISENNPPEKVKPADPGGMEIPHQDTTVYDQLNPKQADASPGEPEKLLPAPEAPVMPTASNTAPSAPEMPQTTPANIPDALPDLPGAPAPAADAQTGRRADASAAPAITPDNSHASSLTPLSAETRSAKGDQASFRIQLGAVRDQATADAEWARMQKKYADALKGLNSNFTGVNLGDKGTFLRIQAGPLTRADAEARCAKLISENQACLIVKAAP